MGEDGYGDEELRDYYSHFRDTSGADRAGDERETVVFEWGGIEIRSKDPRQLSDVLIVPHEKGGVAFSFRVAPITPPREFVDGAFYSITFPSGQAVGVYIKSDEEMLLLHSDGCKGRWSKEDLKNVIATIGDRIPMPTKRENDAKV